MIVLIIYPTKNINKIIIKIQKHTFESKFPLKILENFFFDLIKKRSKILYDLFTDPSEGISIHVFRRLRGKDNIETIESHALSSRCKKSKYFCL